jgi:hypothetical protein
MILDDGGDATLLITWAPRPRQDPSVLDNPGSDEEKVLFAAIRAAQDQPGWYGRMAKEHQGRDRGDHHRRAPPLPDEKGGSCPSRPSTSTTR